MVAPSEGSYSANTRALVARHTALQEEAERIMREGKRAAARDGFPKPAVSVAPPVERGDPRFTTGELVPASCVELDEVVGDDSVVLVARHPITGRVLLKIWMAKADASPEWGMWIRRWVTRKCRRALRLMR